MNRILGAIEISSYGDITVDVEKLNDETIKISMGRRIYGFRHIGWNFMEYAIRFSGDVE